MTDLFGNEEIRKLSFWQPFGTLMFHGKVETRKWSTNYRGLILICTTKIPFHQQPYSKTYDIHFLKKHTDAIDQAVEESIQNGYLQTSHLNGWAIGIGRISECRKVKMNDKTFYLHPPNLFAHIYTDVKRIVPFQIKGAQGLPVRIDDETKSKIKLLC